MSDIEKYTKDDSATIVNNLIAIFSKGMSQSNRDDIQNCLQYVTLAATKRHPEDVQGEQWYQTLTHLMGRYGWVSWHTAYDRASSHAFGITLDQIGVELIKAGLIAAAQPLIGVANVLPLVNKALEGVKASEPAMSALSHAANGGDGKRFSIAACVQADDGTVAMAMGVVSSRHDSQSNQLLFLEHKSESSDTYAGCAVMVFNADRYAAVRDLIIAGLNQNARQALIDFPI